MNYKYLCYTITLPLIIVFRQPVSFKLGFKHIKTFTRGDRLMALIHSMHYRP